MISEEKEAIEELKILKEDYWEDDGYGYATAECQKTITALDMAIEALEQKPCDMKQRVEKEYLYESLCEDLKRANAEIKRLLEPFEDAISRQAVDELSKELVHTTRDKADFLCNFWEGLQKLPSVTPKEKTGWIPVSEKYEHHIDHTDCIWYGDDSDCPVTCSQYRDGWNDAMDYIFKNGDGYRPYRRDENG